MSLRVIAGSAKGRRLKAVPGDTTRPIMDKAKEALFSIIGYDIIETHFLDLFAGTGSVAIEALSRGAKHATLFDLERRAIKTIHDNLDITKLGDLATVRMMDALAYLDRDVDTVYDYIYIAPPQYQKLWVEAVTRIDAKLEWLAENGSVIVQIDPNEYAELPLENLCQYDKRKYGKTMFVFYGACEDFQTTEDTQDLTSPDD